MFSVHAPAVQVCVAVHTWPQVPQLLVSVCSLTHALPQRVSPGPQIGVHVPPVHWFPAVQAWPQAPQLLLSVFSLTQAVPQRVVPGAVH